VVHGPVFISCGDLVGYEFGSEKRNPYQEFVALKPDAVIQDGVAVYNDDYSIPMPWPSLARWTQRLKRSLSTGSTNGSPKSPNQLRRKCEMRRQSRAASHRIRGIHRKTATPYHGSGVVGSRAATGTHKEINKTIQIATFLSTTVFFILSSMIVSYVPIGERHAAALSFSHFPSRYNLSLFPPAFDRHVRLTEIADIYPSEYIPLALRMYDIHDCSIWAAPCGGTLMS
jgi:hypothetical protein